MQPTCSACRKCAPGPNSWKSKEARLCLVCSPIPPGTLPPALVTAAWLHSRAASLLESWLGLDDDRFDGEGRVIVSRFPSFLLYNIYFPNGGQDNGRVPYKLDFYARLLDLCDRPARSQAN